ncbi:hypothetical protein BHM03_00001394 [Ensete ventricosum]|nr:hypothetical protein BHM03_00001394 [Ensete ventricosum]
MNASSREHACSSFMEKAGEFVTLREHTTLLLSLVEEIDTRTAGPRSDGEVAPNEKKARQTVSCPVLKEEEKGGRKEEERSRWESAKGGEAMPCERGRRHGETAGSDMGFEGGPLPMSS